MYIVSLSLFYSCSSLEVLVAAGEMTFIDGIRWNLASAWDSLG